MKLIGRTLAVLAAAMVVVAFWLAVGALGGGAAMVGGMHEHGREGGFRLGGIVQILPTLAVVAIVTAIVAPIKQRLASKRRPGTARSSKVATPAG